jgi:molecular chaperone DnaK
MQQVTIDYGIDLGTTNSVISISQKGIVETIKNGLSEITPSVVYFDKRGTKRVGLGAASMLNRPSSAIDVQSEFKRSMGQSIKLDFKAAGKSMTPEEISSEVLRVLRQAAGLRFGTDPLAAVITVPAMFEFPQNEATANAAKLAGFTYSQLLQEPVAAAVAYGFMSAADKAYWLVYDYGGGTFDASIISIRDGQLSVVKHAGDNYLGGADLDWMIAREIIAPQLKKTNSGLSNLSFAANASDLDRGRMLVLKFHAEIIKKELSMAETASVFQENIFVDDGGNAIDLDITVTREQLEKLAAPAVQRTIDIVNKLILESGIEKKFIDRFLLVGGSTFIPLVRQQTAALGIPMGMDIDPMTVVSRGAAIFAASQRIPSSTQPAVVVPVGTATAQLDHELVTRETSPVVGGKLQINGQAPKSGTTLSIRRSDNGWESGDMPIDSKGMFFTNVQILEKGQSIFQLTVRDDHNTIIPCVPESFAITNGLTVAGAILPAGCGVGLADGRTEMLLPSGTALPASAELYKTQFIKGLKKGSPDTDMIVIPIMSGDEWLSVHNLCGARIEIKGSDIQRDIPVGAHVEISITIDIAGIPKVSVYVPLLDEHFEPKQSMSLEHEPAAVMRGRKLAIEKQLEQVAEKASETDQDNIAEQATELNESDELKKVNGLIQRAESGDKVAAGQARNMLTDIAKRSANLEAQIEWPNTVANFNKARDGVRKLVVQTSDAVARKAVEELSAEGDKAIANKDAKMLAHVSEQMGDLARQLMQNDPAFWVGFLQHLVEMAHRFPDQAAARRLFAEGATAAQRRDKDSLQSVVQQLLKLLPAEAVAEAQAGIKSHIL